MTRTSPSCPVLPRRSPYVPCLFCSNNQWVRGSIRLLNAATGYNPFSIWIDGRLASSGLGFPEITRYNQISQGYHVFTVAGTNGYTYLRKSLYVGGGMATVAIINAPTGLDLTVIRGHHLSLRLQLRLFPGLQPGLLQRSGPTRPSETSTSIPCNLGTLPASAPLTQAAICCPSQRSARPETTLVTTPVILNPRRIYTAYVLNWNPSPDTIQTLLVEDRRN